MTNSPLFEFNLDKELATTILSEGNIKSYNPGDIIVDQDNYQGQTGFVLEGMLKTTIDQKNNSLLLYHICCKRNPILCSKNSAINNFVKTSIIAIMKSSIIWLPTNKVIELTFKFPSLMKTIHTTYQYNINNLLSSLKELKTLSSKNRLYKYLKNTAIIYNDTNIKVSRTEIASDLNLSKASISKALKSLEDENKVTTTPRSIILHPSYC